MTTSVETDRGTIRVSSLTKTYPGPTHGLKVLDDVSLTAERGSYIALRGVSGSGKSTLLNILGGIEVFDSGKVEVSGADHHRFHLPVLQLTAHPHRLGECVCSARTTG